MSLSKGYPYSLNDKIRYYSGNIFCFGCSIFGVNLYSRFVLKNSYFPNKSIKDNDRENLKKAEKYFKKGRKMHTIGIFTGASIFFPAVFALHKYNLIKLFPKQSYSFIFMGGLFLANSLYAIMTYTNNCVRITNHIQLLKYGEIEDKVKTDLSKEKCEWEMLTIQDNNNLVYVVRNSYYIELYFYFEYQKTAENVMKFLKTLTADVVDELNNNYATIRKVQRKLLRAYSIE